MKIYRFTGFAPFLNIAIVCTFIISLSGCATIGPDYSEPKNTAALLWQAPLPHGGSLDALSDWWSQFNDPVLTRFQRSAELDSPTFEKAKTNIQKARATLSSTEASGLPSANAQTSLTRSTQQTSGVATARIVALDASWELDLFGKSQRSSESATARVQARENDWHDARISLAAEVADTYVQYRACDVLTNTYAQELTSMRETTIATESLIRAGLAAGTEGSLARASLASVTSAGLLQSSQCELFVKSLVNLTGIDESEIRRQLLQGGTGIPQPGGLNVKSIPSETLRQRPDLASRERELAAASAEIGVAQAELYPSLSLSGAISVSATGLASVLTSWSFGPKLSIPLFDGGRGRAAVSSAKANYEAAYSDWRQNVRTVIKEVEQSLVRLDSAAKRTDQSELSAKEYRQYLVGAEAQWRAGTTSLLALEESRRQALSAQVELIGLQRDRVTSWIALYKALGGGWQPEATTNPNETTVVN